MARLGDICDILNGYAFKSEKYVSEGIRIIRIANVQKGYIEDSAPVFYPIKSEDANKFLLQEGDLLMSLTGNVGRVALLEKNFLPAALNQRVACLRIKKGKQIDKGFLFNFLNSDYFENQCILASKGVAQKNMSTTWLKDFEIPDFSIGKQLEISNQMSKINDLILWRKKQITELDQLVKSQFIELLKNHKSDEYTLGDICTKGPQNGFYRKGAEVDGTVPIVKMKQLFANESISNATDFDLVAPTDKELDRFRLTQNDLLFGRRSLVVEGAGKCRRAGKLSVDCIFESSLLRVSLNPKIIKPRFLQCWFDSQDGKEIINSIRAVTTIAGIKGSDLARIKVPVQPIELQNTFEEFLEQTDKSKCAIQQSLEQLETLKKSLMQEYFG